MPDNNHSSAARDKSFCSEENLRKYLKDKGHFSLEEQQQLKYFIDNYSDCWRIWNKVRWDAAMHTQGVEELKEYLGKDFVPYYDSSWELAKEWQKKSPSSDEEIANFYRSTQNYVYNLVIWNESGDRTDYSSYIHDLLTKYSVESVIDFGCGVGTDTLTFIEENVDTYSVDFNCPATDFLKWRLRKRDLETNFLNIDEINKLPDADMFWAIDVLEHIPNPMDIINMINISTCKVFAHCSRFNDNAGGRHPCHINFESSKISDFLISKKFKNVLSSSNLSVWVNLNLVNKNA